MKRRNDKVTFGSEVSFDVKGLNPIMGAVKNALGREIEGAEFRVLYGEINDNYRKASEQKSVLALVPPKGDFSCTLQVGESLNCPPVQFELIISKNKDFNPLRAGGGDWKARRYVARVQLLEVRNVYDFRVDGNLLDLDPTAMSDVLEALREISQRVDLTDERFNEYVTRNLCQSYNEKKVMGNCRFPMLLDTGLTYREGSIEGEDGVLRSGVPILIRIEHDDEVPTSFGHACRIRIVLDPKSPFEYVSDPRDCVSRLHRDVALASIEEALPRLCELAEPEDWGGDSLGGLRYYLKSVYHRLKDDEKVDESGRWPSFCCVGDVVVFCTGLFTRRGGHFIYAKLSDKKDGRFQKLEWLSHVTSPDGHRLLNPELEGLDETGKVNHGLPYPPNWIREPERLLFDYHYGSRESGDIDFNFSHIYQNLKSRGENPVAFIARYPKRTSSFDDEIRRRFGMTRKLLQKNFKIAIPMFYRGKIQLLVPLYLEENPKKVSVALVVTLNQDPKRRCHYYCPTCLSLDMARRDARVITRMSDTWLEKRSPVRSYDNN